ncbi:MAG: hypothetical protein JSR56_06485 [Proteobacteria bacterium]|nr:hypothetical protein [Pseudomonadota bacterium]
MEQIQAAEHSAQHAVRAATVLMLLALLLTVLAYWIGLSGPFVLDDANNLSPILAWLQGADTWQQVLLGNASGLFYRPLSMATLMFSAWAGGYTPFAFKLGNLVMHLLCGLAGWRMLRRAFDCDTHFRRHADIVAALLAAAWLLHPLNASTVLYAVQRMAQVSTLFTLAAVWAYLVARKTMAQERTRRGAAIGLFVVFPLLTLLGLLGKENAAVAPALCLVFELAYFHRADAGTARQRDKRMLGIFYALFLLLPLLLATIAFLTNPDRFLGGYAIRDFTLGQRLLTEPRVLIDYIQSILLPMGSNLGFYHDDFPVSTSLSSPPSTALSLLVLIAVSALAIGLRKRAPSLFAGWFFFLVAHSIESSVFPLELYFEHRNYLPAFGLLLAVAGVVELLTRRLRSRMPLWKAGSIAAGVCVLALGVATHARAWVWADEGRLLEREATQHPGSLRANTQLAFYAIQHGKPNLANALIDGLLESPDPRVRELGFLNRVLAGCVASGNARSGDLQKAVELARPRVTLEEMHVFSDLAQVNEQRTCNGAGPIALADAAVAIVDAAHGQSDNIQPKWSMRLTAARLYANGGNWKLALKQAELAWQPGADAPVGAFLVRAYVHNGMHAEAERTYSEVAGKINRKSAADRSGLEELKKFIDHDSRAADKPARSE